MDIKFRLPRFLQKGMHVVPFAGDVLNVIGEYSNNIKAGLSPKEAARRASAVGAAGMAASAVPPADVATYAPVVLRYGAAQQRQAPSGETYQLMRDLGVATPPSPQVLEKTAEMLDYVNPEAWARTLVDKLDPALKGITFSLNPDERLRQLQNLIQSR